MTVQNIPLKHSIASGCVLVMLFTLLSPLSLHAFGSKEKGTEGGSALESEREVEVFVLSTSGSAAASSPALAESAAAFLFREFSADGSSISIQGSRRFSMPILERSVQKTETSASLLVFRLRLEKFDALQYSKVEEVSVSFSVDELVSGDRIRLQPSQKALLDAVAAADRKSGLVRIRELSVDRSGVFKGIAEIASRL
jgi:hypothetical protein